MIQPKVTTGNLRAAVRNGAKSTAESNATEKTTANRLATSTTTIDSLLRDPTSAEFAFNAETTEGRLSKLPSKMREIGLATQPIDQQLYSPSSYNQTSLVAVSAPVPVKFVPRDATVETPAAPETELFIGDPPVSDQWLSARNAIFDEIRTDYQESLVAYQGDKAGFHDQFLAQPNALLNQLAAHYEIADQVALIERYPDIIDIAVRSDRLENAGPGLNGRSMMRPDALLAIDMLLSDPDVQLMMDEMQVQVSPPVGDSARALLYQYGENRFEQIQRYHAVMEQVRGDYLDSLHLHGRNRNSEFIEHPTNEAMQVWQSAHQAIVDEAPAVSERARRAQFALSGPEPHEIRAEYQQRLDTSQDSKPNSVYHVDQMTASYIEQDTPTARLFSTFFGQATESDKAYTSPLITHDFAGGGFGLNYRGTDGGLWRFETGSFRSNEIEIVDPENLPQLHNDEAIFFSPGVGWYTPDSNLVVEPVWFETAIDIAIVGGVGLYFGGVGAGVAAGFGGVSGAVIGGMIGGGATAAFAGAYHGNFDWGDVWDGALTGGLSAGLNQIRAIQRLNQTAAGSIVANTIVSGTVAEVVHGDGENGAINGLLASVSNQMFQQMNSDITNAGLTGAEEVVARQTARLVSTAVRVANTEGHPGQVFAQGLLNDLVQHVGQPIYDAGFEDGVQLGEAANDAFQNWIGGGGSGGGVEPSFDGSTEELHDDLLEALIIEFNAEVNDILKDIETKIANIDAEIAATSSDNGGALYLLNVQREALVRDQLYFQGLASDPMAVFDSFIDETQDLGSIILDELNLRGGIYEGIEQLTATMHAAVRYQVAYSKIHWYGSDEDLARLDHVDDLLVMAGVIGVRNWDLLLEIVALDGLVDNTAQFAGGQVLTRAVGAPATWLMTVFAAKDFLLTNYDIIAGPIENTYNNLYGIEY